MRTSLAVLAALVAACSGTKTNQNANESAATPPADSAAAPAPVAPAPAPAAPTVTDPQIAAIVVAANDVDIAAARLVPTRAQNADVKSFAKQMITDHSAVNQQATALVKKLNVTPEPNPTSQQLTQGGEQNRQALQGKHGSDFDRAYIDNEVTFHQAVLDAIDQTLIPSAQNAELKTLLEQTRPAFEGHLEHAKKIQAALAH